MRTDPFSNKRIVTLNHAGWIAHDEAEWRNGSFHNRASTYNRSMSNFGVGQQDSPASNSAVHPYPN